MKVNYENVKDLRKLTNECLIVTKPLLMRGVDYRSIGKMIALLITRPFDNKRALHQAEGRVGRYDEVCERYMLSTTPTLVDRPAWLAQLAKLKLKMKMKK